MLSLDLGDAWPYPPPALLRNLAGFAGLAFLADRLVGAQPSWTSPVVFGMFAYLVARLVGGLGPVCLIGARQPAGETE